MSEYREQLNRIETKVDRVDEKVNKLALHTEHRVTKLETKAGVFGMIGGALSYWVAHLFKGNP